MRTAGAAQIAIDQLGVTGAIGHPAGNKRGKRDDPGERRENSSQRPAVGQQCRVDADAAVQVVEIPAADFEGDCRTRRVTHHGTRRHRHRCQQRIDTVGNVRQCHARIRQWRRETVPRQIDGQDIESGRESGHDTAP
jgi:hypothetical protein